MSKRHRDTMRLTLADGSTVDADFDDKPVDLQTEVTSDSKDRRIDHAYVEEAVADVHAYLAAHPEVPAAGRPSLTAPGQHSPHVAFRVPADIAEQLDTLSRQRGISRSALAREALTDYLRRTS